jgi:chromosome partitioning protein
MQMLKEMVMCWNARRLIVPVIVLANLKGGVTKTTTAINAAVAASLLGKRVLVIDTDLQGNATTALGYESSALEHTVYTLMLGQSRFEDVVLQSYFDKTTKRFIDPTDDEMMQKRRIKSENLVAGPDLLPCNVNAAQAENDLIRNPAWGSLLRNALQAVRSQYDYIFIDTHPDLGKMTVNSFIAADLIVIPLVPEPWPTDGLLVLSASIADAQLVNPTLRVAGILFTRVRYAEHTKLMEYVRETLVERINTNFPQLQLSCFTTSVNESASFIASTNRRSCVVLSHPTDAVSLSYWAFFTEILQKEESDDFAVAYEQFQQLLAVYKTREQEKTGARQKIH